MRRITAHRTAAVWGSSALVDRLGADTTPALPDAACTRVDPEVFFPDQDNPAAVAAARGVCLVCPVHAQCLEVFGDLPYGVVAGLTASERRARRHPHVPPAA